MVTVTFALSAICLACMNWITNLNVWTLQGEILDLLELHVRLIVCFNIALTCARIYYTINNI